jgi:hypothetical protein
VTRSAPDRDAELALAERVGRELVRAGLPKHADRVRAYYAAVRAGRSSDAWSHAMSIEWMRLLRVPPYENDFPVRPRMSACPTCPISRAFTTTIFPGGSKHQCACGAAWLEFDVLAGGGAALAPR